VPVEWFKRLGDIPGLDYETPAGIDRTAIPGHDMEPEVQRWEMHDGEVHEQMSWPRTIEPVPGEEPTPSHLAPVSAHLQAFYDTDELQPASELIQRIHEALELPGRGTDYHFALQQALPQLRSRMLEAPEVLRHVEALAWLDIKLALAYPQAVSTDIPGDNFRFFMMEAFNTLGNLYSGEGFMNEAMEVARVAEQFEQRGGRLESLQERLAAIRAEDED
jgi:hypothetical protein